MRAVRRRLAETAPEAAVRLAAHVDALTPGDPVALYRAVGGEIDPEPLARALLQRGRRLCLPVVVARNAPLVFRAWAWGEPLAPDLAGCPAPLAKADEVDPALILVPLLAFDDRGGRLGQGGGYYDRTLAARPGVTAIGLAYAGQQAERLPTDAHDAKLHGVLTETGYRPLP